MKKQPPLSAVEFGNLLSYFVTTAGSQKAAARNLKVSPQYLSDVLNGRREPGKSILNALGYEKRVTYHRKP